MGLAPAASSVARRQLEVASAIALEATDGTRHRDGHPSRDHVDVARAKLVRSRARKQRLAHRAARILLPQLPHLLVGDASPARARRGLWHFGCMPVRHVADRRSSRGPYELLRLTLVFGLRC